MKTIQYRDAETDTLLECATAEAMPSIGQTVWVGVHRYRVLYRWRSVPGASVVYVRGVGRPAAA